MSQEESADISQFMSSGENGEHETGNESSKEDGARAWADDTSDFPSIPVPYVLANLIRHGTRFRAVSQWSSAAKPTLKKNLSVYFRVDTIVTSQAILEAFDAAGIEIDFISSIQWRASNRM